MLRSPQLQLFFLVLSESKMSTKVGADEREPFELLLVNGEDEVAIGRSNHCGLHGDVNIEVTCIERRLLEAAEKKRKVEKLATTLTFGQHHNGYFDTWRYQPVWLCPIES